jgi:proline dehydrogenase
MLKSTILFFSERQGLKNLVMRVGPARRVAWRFVAGETLENCISAVRAVNARGLSASFDHLGENVDSKELATQAADAYLAALEAIDREKLDANVSLKLTQMGLDLGEGFTYQNVHRILARAKALNIFVRIDMEHSDYLEQTLVLLRKFRAEFDNVGIVLQSYLYRTEADALMVTGELGCRVRLVKGAYKEKPELAFQKKSDVDKNYLDVARALLADGKKSGRYHAFGTQDPAMIAGVKAAAAELGVEKTAYEFQMLYGIRRDLQESLKDEGHNMRVYIPFGTDWYPYLMRRMAERPANLLFVLKNMFRG